MSGAVLHCGDALTVLRTLPDASARCCVTSPPYWGLRDYGIEGQLGLERTPEEYIAKMVAVFAEVRRVLTDDGTLWLNVGDSYAAGGGKQVVQTKNASHGLDGMRQKTPGFAAKNLIGIPWRLAFALQEDGWTLRCDIIWAKPNPMPESVTDRPTKAHEYLFLLSKSAIYYYDADAIAEAVIKGAAGSTFTEGKTGVNGNGRQQSAESRAARTAGKHSTTAPQAPGRRMVDNVKRARLEGGSHESPFGETRNARSVWTIATKPYAGAHFATFPEELARRCILAGSAPGDVVLDPFGGSGTVAAVATGHGREAIHIDLKYHDLAEARIGPMLCVSSA